MSDVLSVAASKNGDPHVDGGETQINGHTIQDKESSDSSQNDNLSEDSNSESDSNSDENSTSESSSNSDSESSGDGRKRRYKPKHERPTVREKMSKNSKSDLVSSVLTETESNVDLSETGRSERTERRTVGNKTIPSASTSEASNFPYTRFNPLGEQKPKLKVSPAIKPILDSYFIKYIPDTKTTGVDFGDVPCAGSGSTKGAGNRHVSFLHY